jgi:HAE1 family hydrophobic/amphiphilic exporter-1
MNGKPAAIIAIYQLPGSNAIQTMDAAKKLMEEMKSRFPADLDYVTSAWGLDGLWTHETQHE